MINHADNAVSIQLRNLDGINLEGESDKEDGKGPAGEEILKSQRKATHRWDTFMILLRSCAFLVDPLLCYIIVIEEDHMCIWLDMKLVWVYIALRIVIDVFYVTDIIILFRGIYKKRKGHGKKFRACWKPRTDHQKSIALPLKQEIERWDFLHDLLSILARVVVAPPIAEGLYLSSIWLYWDPTYLLFIITPIQFTLRIFLIYGSRRWRRIKKNTTTAGRWLKHMLDFLPFIFASHVFGAMWYYLATQRQMDCWEPHCKTILGYECKTIYDYVCHNDKTVNSTFLQNLCPTNNEDKKVFDFGAYLYAVQSKTTGPFNLPRRVSQSFWWALRNLSSFGSNLQTSMHTLEILFSGAISISGMGLFIVYLNERVKGLQETSNQLQAKEKKNLMKPGIDLWLSKNIISKDLKAQNKMKKALKEVIIKNIYKLEENKDIDVQNIISILPIKYKNNIMRLLCLTSLKKVPLLANLNDKMLKVICEHLKPIIYIEDNYIVKQGKPLGMMLFITQGIAWTYTTSKIDGAETSCGSSSNKWLKRGDFYGEELLNWAIKCPSFSDLPISTRNVMCQEKIEAFSLRASDLKSIVSKFWWHFTTELHQAELEQWQNSAASSIQEAWRSCGKGGSQPLKSMGKLTVE